MKLLFACMLLLLFTIPLASAHTTVKVGSYQLKAGWDIEPPLVDFRNKIVVTVTQNSSSFILEPVTDAFADLETTVKFGGVSKTLVVNNDSNPVQYSSKIIPTEIGSYTISLTGMIDTTPVDVEISIQDVGTSDSLDFPIRQSSSNNESTAIQETLNLLEQDIRELQNDNTINDESTAIQETLNLLEQDIRELQNDNTINDESTAIQETLNLLEQDIRELQNDNTINDESTYDLAILGASMGIIGLIVGIIAIIAIIKKR